MYSVCGQETVEVFERVEAFPYALKGGCIGLDEVGDHDSERSGRVRGCYADARVLEDEAVGWGKTERAGCDVVDLRIGFTASDLVTADYGVEAGCDTCTLEEKGCPWAVGGGGDGHGNAASLKESEQAMQALFEGNSIGLDRFLEIPEALLPDRIIREIGTEGFQDDLPAPFFVPAGKAALERCGKLEAGFMGGANPGLNGYPFCIEHEAIHIEDDRPESESYHGS